MTNVRAVLLVTGLACGTAQAQSIPFVPVLDASYEAMYQDVRSQTSIQYDLARFLVDRTLPIEFADPEDRGPSMFCWAEGSNPTPEQIAALNMAIEGFGSRYEIGGSRWGSSNPNTPTTVYWSFVPDGLSIPGGTAGDPTAPSELFSRMDSLFSGSGGRATWIAKLQACFDRWGQMQGITYVRVTPSGNDWDDGAAWGTSGSPALRGDVRIGMHNIDAVNGILAYNSFPGTGAGGDMVIDRSEGWALSTNDYRYLRNVVMHEHGHGIGLFHTCPLVNQKLMEPATSTNPPFDGPQQDDIRGAQWYYGDIFEPNNNVGTATDLGVPAVGVLTTYGGIAVTSPPSNASTMSVAGDSDQDWYKISLDIPRLVNIIVQPIGSTYTTGPQTGPCNTGSSVNALTAADLQLDVYNAGGVSQYYSGNIAAVGVNESVTALVIPQGFSNIRITEAGTTTTTQMYKLQIQPRTDVITPTASDGTFTDKISITWPAIPNATDYQLYRNAANSQAGATQIFAGLATSFDDTTAVPGQQYYYYLRVVQTGGSIYRYTAANGSGEPGMRTNVPPVANAGPDQNLTDSDNSGSEPVTLNGSASTDTGGSIVSYLWKEGVTNLAPASGSPTLNTSLSVGVHTITLTVTDNSGAPDDDTVTITIAPGGTTCDSIDFNNDGLFPDTADIDDFLSVFSGGPCSTGTCGDIDFNNDGLFPDTTDIDSLLSVFSGGTCF